MSRIARAWQALTGAAPQRKGLTLAEALAPMLGAHSASGPHVTHAVAVTVGAVLACARVIANLASYPLRLIDLSETGGHSIVTAHPAARLIARPNLFQTPMQWLETAIIHAVLAGTHISHKTGGGPYPVELLPIEPGAAMRTRRGYDILWTLTYPDGGGTLTVADRDVLRIDGPGWDGCSGWNIVQLARETIGMALATEQYGAGLFRHGVRPSGYFEALSDPGPAELETLRQQLSALYGGAGNAGRAMVLSGLTWRQMAMTANEAQFIETRRFLVEEVCRFLAVDPVMVFAGGQSATYASVEAKFANHVRQTLAPWARRVELALDRCLLTPDDVARGLAFRFDLGALMRGSTLDQANAYQRQLGSPGAPGWRTPNEIRRENDLPPLPGGDALFTGAASGDAAAGEGPDLPPDP